MKMKQRWGLTEALTGVTEWVLVVTVEIDLAGMVVVAVVVVVIMIDPTCNDTLFVVSFLHLIIIHHSLIWLCVLQSSSCSSVHPH